MKPTPRDFPLHLERRWRIDLPHQIGRLRALAALNAMAGRRVRPLPYDQQARRCHLVAIAAE